MNLIFGRGEEVGEIAQHCEWEAEELKATTIPVLSVTPKDLKPLTPEGDPKTSQLCGASSSINRKLSEWTSSIEDPANEIVI